MRPCIQLSLSLPSFSLLCPSLTSFISRRRSYSFVILPVHAAVSSQRRRAGAFPRSAGVRLGRPPARRMPHVARSLSTAACQAVEERAVRKQQVACTTAVPAVVRREIWRTTYQRASALRTGGIDRDRDDNGWWRAGPRNRANDATRHDRRRARCSGARRTARSAPRVSSLCLSRGALRRGTRKEPHSRQLEPSFPVRFGTTSTYRYSRYTRSRYTLAIPPARPGTRRGRPTTVTTRRANRGAASGHALARFSAAPATRSASSRPTCALFAQRGAISRRALSRLTWQN